VPPTPFQTHNFLTPNLEWAFQGTFSQD
jgi:hypothetical protein